MDVRLRDAEASDFDAITALYAGEVARGVATYELEAPDTDVMQQRWRAIVDGGYPYLVAESDDGFAGYAYASAYRTRAGYRWTVESTVYVAAHARGAGVGRRLMTALIERCTAQGFRQMIAVVGDADNTVSVRLHERLGFQRSGRFPGIGRKHGRWLDGLQMQRALGDGATTPPSE